MPYDLNPAGAARLQRANGRVDLVFGPAGLVDLYQSDPCRVLFPKPEQDDPFLATLITTSGGLTGGDRLDLRLTAQDDACATVTTQAAEKIYRSLGEDCRIDIDIAAGQGWLEYLPQETILFDGARLRRQTDIAVTTESAFLGCEMLVFGRSASGEQCRDGFAFDRWRVRVGERLVWTDTLRLDDPGADLEAPFGFAGANAVATTIYVAPGAECLIEPARELLAQPAGRAAVTHVNGVLLARFLGEASAVRGDLGGYLAGLRHIANKLPARLPRVWRI